jgi:hypothetical protein
MGKGTPTSLRSSQRRGEGGATMRRKRREERGGECVGSAEGTGVQLDAAAEDGCGQGRCATGAPPRTAGGA